MIKTKSQISTRFQFSLYRTNCRPKSSSSLTLTRQGSACACRAGCWGGAAHGVQSYGSGITSFSSCATWRHNGVVPAPPFTTTHKSAVFESSMSLPPDDRCYSINLDTTHTCFFPPRASCLASRPNISLSRSPYLPQIQSRFLTVH